jgi:hypothetical protein
VRFERWLRLSQIQAGSRTLLAGGALADVAAPPPGELLSETNGNPVVILLSFGTARVFCSLVTGGCDYQLLSPTCQRAARIHGGTPLGPGGDLALRSLSAS